MSLDTGAKTFLFLFYEVIRKMSVQNIKPSYDEIKLLKGDYKVVPICKEIYADIITPISLLRKISKYSENYYLLESVEGERQWGRYSFLGINPIIKVSCKDGTVFIKDNNGITAIKTDEPIDKLIEILLQYKTPKFDYMPSFTGGFVGYFAYEMLGYAEPTLKLKKSDVNDYDLMLFDKVIAYDHLKQKIVIIVNMKLSEGQKGYDDAVNEINRLLGIITQDFDLPKFTAEEAPEFKCNLTVNQYCDMVEKTIEYIRNGDIFQGVISRRFEADYNSSLINAYRVLRTTNPSPYMYFIKNDDLEIAGTSPETLVKLENGILSTFPVAGTRPRGTTKEIDEQLEKELLADQKELAEHNMLVDLARNDIGKISKFNSVYVSDYMVIHRYSKVMHIASVVKGEIKDENTVADAVKSILPAGTLSGAPKIRACEIIDELEPNARGVYGGAIGYLDFSGNMDICIAIRTAVKKGNKVYVQAGAGVVADSIPINEYNECGNKAAAVLNAIKNASEVND